MIPDTTPPNTADRCPRCAHNWHGIDCRVSHCICPTAWTDPEGMPA